jgi:hypothetical protein
VQHYPSTISADPHRQGIHENTADEEGIRLVDFPELNLLMTVGTGVKIEWLETVEPEVDSASGTTSSQSENAEASEERLDSSMGVA